MRLVNKGGHGDACALGAPGSSPASGCCQAELELGAPRAGAGKQVQVIFPDHGAMTEAQLDVPQRKVTPDIATYHRVRVPDSRVPGGPSCRAGAPHRGGVLSSHGSACRN